jgi:hypothetical protein
MVNQQTINGTVTELQDTPVSCTETPETPRVRKEGLNPIVDPSTFEFKPYRNAFTFSFYKSL